MASNAFQPVQGMSDLDSPDIYLWQYVEKTAREIFERYGFGEVRTPIIEKSKVFLKSLGDTTDIVQKEMYSFEDRGGRNLTIRPEGTAGTIRYLGGLGEDGLNARVYYMGPMFRCERPQAGRKRQFHQIGVEATGAANALADVEVIAMQEHLLTELGLPGARIVLNSRGTAEDRKPVSDGLRAALKPFEKELCEDCQRRIDENVLRVIDCKNEDCQKIVDQLPEMRDFMCEESRVYLDEVIARLRELGVDAQYDPKLVRGLDYYCHTVWEVQHDALGAQNALSGGGRYEVMIGNKTVPGVGFALGVERLITAMEAAGVTSDKFIPPAGVWLVSLGDAALAANIKLAQTLRKAGIKCGLELEIKSMKAQMRKANKAGAQQCLILGDDELAKGVAILKNMEEGTQIEVALTDLISKLKK
jgi:histidyl-tRNA synthetase